MAPNVRVLLAEDHRMVREGLAALLGARPGLEIVGEASDGEEALRLAEARGPDIAILDVGLPIQSGVEVATKLRKSRPDIAVVMLSMHDDASTVDRALRAGAKAYVLKGAGIESLVEAIQAVRRGEVYLSPGVSGHVVQGYLSGPGDPDPLSAREREVVQLISEGLTARKIADRLGLSPKTIENHRARILEKLGIGTTAGLVRWAVRMGLVR